MKTRGILIALSIAMFISFNAFANATEVNGKNNPDSVKNRVDIRVNKDNNVVLRAECLGNQKWTNMVLEVHSATGEMVFFESFHKKGGIYKGFDMSSLPDGKYTFEIHQNFKKIYSKDIQKSTELVSQVTVVE